MKKSRILQTVWVVVLAVCTLFFGFISVMASIPEQTEVEAAELVRASAYKEMVSDTGYRIDVMGSLRNATQQPMVSAQVEILLTDEAGTVEKSLVLEDVTLMPKNPYEVSGSTVSEEKLDVVKEVKVTVNGESYVVRNHSVSSFSSALIAVAITAIFAFFLVRSCKVRYYMMVEDRADRREAM